MVQEERRRMSLDQSPSLKEVEDACEVLLMKNPSVCRRNTEEGYKGGVENHQ